MSFTQTKTFSINQSPVSLEVGDVLKFKFVLKGSTNSNFTASLSEGSLDIYSLAPSLGYATTNCFYFHSSSMSASIANGTTNVITFSPGLSSFYNGNYQFAPNPLTGSVNSLYPVYGDVDYAFSFRPYDIIVTYLSDNTYVESRILETTVSGSLVNIRLNTEMSNLYRNNLMSGSYQRFLILKRVEDETSAYLTFNKRSGKTSYGFAIPEDLSPQVLSNIDEITRQVKQKLLADQQGTVS
jgi:hypothetical protein